MIHGFVRCVCYAAALGIAVFPLGRLLARVRFNPESFPFAEWPFENGGKVYRRLGIHRWQNRLPDMSRVFRTIMPAKSLYPGISAEEVDVMVQETCIAEVVHSALCVLGLWILRLWRGWGGILFYAIYALFGNVAFILIQRFNRPKLTALAEKLRGREVEARSN